MDPADRKWLAALRDGRPDGDFGHREHLRLAWLALEEPSSLDAACQTVAASVRAVARTHGVPQKYNETVTGAWVRIVSHVRSEHRPRTFGELLEAAPWLTDKRLLLRHYTSRTLAAQEAREVYVAPDVQPIPE